MSAEEWRAVPGAYGYDVSDRGRVRSWRLAGSNIKARTAVPRARRYALNVYGYPSLRLVIDGACRTVLIHRLVTLAFIGPRPDGMEVRHLDGDKTNNALANLVYGTKSENQLDNVMHGTHPNTRKSACLRGHPFDTVNTYLDPRGKRQCRTCRKAQKLKAVAA